MMKFMRILLIIFAVIVILVIAAVAIFSNMAKQKAEQYYEFSNSVGEIETKYTAMGSLETSYREYKTSDDVIKRIVIWYPAELAESAKSYPVVVWANGTGSTSSTYTAFFKHLASWGFIVVGNDDENTRTGESLNRSINLLIQENDSKDSIFFKKINLDRIGIGGHSQGGPAVFNMATVQPHADMIKTVYAVSATSSYHTQIFGDGWEYDISKVTVPTFLTAGTGSFDAGTATSKDQGSDEKSGIMQGISPLWSLEENFGLLPGNIDKVYARKINVDHGDSYLQFDGYMTAWFRYYLMDDKEARKAFFGENPELENNQNYQDVSIHEKE